MAKHTPGPWRVEENTTLVWGNCSPDDYSTRGMGYPIATCRTNPSGNWSTGPYADEAEANARLTAAAPELLEALTMFRDYGCPVCQGDCASANPPVSACPMQMAQAAIAKATTP